MHFEYEYNTFSFCKIFIFDSPNCLGRLCQWDFHADLQMIFPTESCLLLMNEDNVGGSIGGILLSVLYLLKTVSFFFCKTFACDLVSFFEAYFEDV